MFYDKFNELCIANKKAPSTVAREVGFAKSNVTAWKNGIATPNARIVRKIATYFGVSADFFLETEPQKEKTPPITDDELELIMRMRKLNQQRVDQVSSMVDFLIAQSDQ
jgi:transcriptional regulator with XRE-family HTH domain